MPKDELSPDLAKELKNVATPVAIHKGNVIFRAGQPARGAFLIRRGQVAMRLDHPSCLPTRTVGSGRMIGLPATFSGEPYSLTAEAKTDCLLYFISRPMMLSLLRHNPKVGYQVVSLRDYSNPNGASATERPRYTSLEASELNVYAGVAQVNG
jgi:CRP-like cAMP-binding protein